MLWCGIHALRNIPDAKAGILPFEVNQRYIEDKDKVSKGDAQMQRAADHLAYLFGKLSTVFNL